MPKLRNAIIEIKSQPSSELDLGRMGIIFLGQSVQDKHTDYEEFRLSVSFHTPSASAVDIWKDSLLRTKRLKLAIDFKPAPSLDENGKLRDHGWQGWET